MNLGLVNEFRQLPPGGRIQCRVSSITWIYEQDLIKEKSDGFPSIKDKADWTDNTVHIYTVRYHPRVATQWPGMSF